MCLRFARLSTFSKKVFFMKVEDFAMNYLKKLALLTLASLISSSTGSAMDDSSVQIQNAMRSFIAELPDKTEMKNLKDFITEGFQKDTSGSCPPKEFLDEVISTIDCLQDYIAKNKDNLFNKKTIQTQRDYNSAEIGFAKIVKMFYYAFDSWIKSEGNGCIENLPFVVFRRDIQEKVYSRYYYYKDYFDIFQKLSNSFFQIRERNQLHLPSADIEIIITKEAGLGMGAFKEESGYVPFPIVPAESWWPVTIFYGSQQNPQKHFIFSKGNLVPDTGILISPDNGYFKFLGQYGQGQAFPYTSAPITLRVPFEDNSLFLQSLKNVLGKEDMKHNFHFVSLPHTVEEQNMLELLFLEDLLEEKKKYVEEEVLFPAQKFIKWIESEEGAGLPIEEIHQQMEGQIKAQVVPKEEIKEEIREEPRKINRGHKKAGKGQKHKGAKKPLEKSRQKGKKEDIFEKVKQEGRIKFQKIRGIINEIFKSAGNEEIYKKFLTVKKDGSHITFHCPEQEPLTLVRKHGKDDLTVPASQVNRFSLRLINILWVGDAGEGR